MMLLNKLDEQGKLAWITVLVVAFWVAWPIGLAAVAFLAITGRLQAWRSEAQAEGWFDLNSIFARRQPRNGTGHSGSSGNKAFDDYRKATLRQLENDQREFQAFLERLRQARDKAEFDAFMQERRNQIDPLPETRNDPAS